MNTFDLYPIQKNSQENIYNTINSFFLKYVYIFTFLHFYIFTFLHFYILSIMQKI